MKKLILVLLSLIAVNSAFANTAKFNAAVGGCTYWNQGGLGSPRLSKDYTRNEVSLHWNGPVTRTGINVSNYVQTYSCANESGKCTILRDELGYARILHLQPDGSFVYVNSAGQGGAFVCPSAK